MHSKSKLDLVQVCLEEKYYWLDLDIWPKYCHIILMMPGYEILTWSSDMFWLHEVQILEVLDYFKEFYFF